MRYDVVVVGGRVAGSASSLFASKNGLDVLMIEKRQEIGTPVQCAGVTSKETFNILDITPDKSYLRNEIAGVDFYAPNGRYFHVNATELYAYTEGYVVERKVFDKQLAIEAANAGTEIMVKTSMKGLLKRDGKICGVVAKHLGKTYNIHADIVIAADGIESKTARMAGLKTVNKPSEIASCAQYEMVGMDTHPNYLQIHFGDKIAPGGYLWVIPKGDRVANVGLGILNSENTAYHYLNNFTKNLDATPVELNVGGVPLSGPIEKTYSSGLLVVGDAAGQVDPINGAGIENAVICGKIAGEVSGEAIENDDTSETFLKRYEELWKLTLGKNFESSLNYRKIFDKLTDEDFNILAEFLEGKDIESISKISILNFLRKYPHLITLLINVFILRK